MPLYKVDYVVSAVINVMVDAPDEEEASAIAEMELPWDTEIDGNLFSILRIHDVETSEVED